jgi:hypothetical protein
MHFISAFHAQISCCGQKQKITSPKWVAGIDRKNSADDWI